MSIPDTEHLGPPPEDLETRRRRNEAGRALFAEDAPNLMRIGRFALESQLGTGGQGVVYLARDPNLERTVALKRLAVASARHIERMRQEALALAQVSHDNVVKVFELDEDETGRPFLVMELVEGQPLNEWLAAEARSWETVVDAFIAVGDGLAAVHAAGLIHRDIKPHNIVIAADGRSKLVDFGIASLHDEEASRATIRDVSVIGTLGYMAPEQRLGRPGPQSDQFAFCVALYEALHGTRPSRPDAPHDAATPGSAPPTAPTAPDASEPRRAAKGIRHAPRQLERLIARGLHEDPAQRHPDMRSLVAALRRLRHRAPIWPVVALAMAVGLLGVATIVLATNPSESQGPCAEPETARRMWDDEHREAVRMAFEATGAPEATASFAAVHGMLGVAATALDERLEEICEAEGDANERERALGQLGEQQGLLRTLVGSLAETDAESIVDVPSRLAGSLARLHAGKQDACELSRPVVDGVDLAELRALGQRAVAANVAGHYDQALALSAEALELATGDALAPMRARLHLLRGTLALEGRRFDVARTELDQARSLAEVNDCDGLGAEALALWAKASLLDSRPDVEQAEDATKQALEKLDSLRDDDGPRRAEALNSRGLVLQSRGEHAAAIEAFEHAIAIRQVLVPPLPLELSDSLLNLGITQAQQGDPRAAIDTLERARLLREQALWPEHPSLFRIHASLSYRWLAIGELDTAERELTRALELARGLGPGNLGVAQLHIGMARLLDHRHEFGRALEHAHQADAMLKALYGEHGLERLGALEAVGQVYMDAGWPERAVPVLELALSLQVSADANALDLATGRGKLAQAHARAGRPETALRLYDEAWRAFADDPSLRGDAFYPELQLGRGETLLELRRGAEAIEPLRAAMAWWTEHDDNPERLAHTRWSLALALCPDVSARPLAEQALAYFQSGEVADTAGAGRMRTKIVAWLTDGCLE
jgi:eukaryotic-like serine/threonine-protein kinase